MDASRTGDPSQASELEAAAWFFENSLDVFLVIRDGAVCRVNPAWTVLTGWTAGETCGQPVDKFVHPDDWAAVRDVVGALQAGGEHRNSNRMLTKSGDWRWIASRTRRAADGSALVALKDVTEERTRQAEAAGVARSGELLRDEAGLILWRFDPEQRIRRRPQPPHRRQGRHRDATRGRGRGDRPSRRRRCDGQGLCS